MVTSKELYKTLSADFKTERRFYFAERGEGMMQAREKDFRRMFLVNNNTKEAWELLAANGRFSFWDASAVEIASAFNLPYRAQRICHGLFSRTGVTMPMKMDSEWRMTMKSTSMLSLTLRQIFSSHFNQWTTAL